MAAATVNIPAIVMNVGPMLNGEVTSHALLMPGYAGRRLLGSGTLLWDARAAQAEGKINQEQLIRLVATSAPRYAKSLFNQSLGTDSIVSATVTLWVLQAQ
jgi:dihydroxy-acid dehydratase